MEKITTIFLLLLSFNTFCQDSTRVEKPDYSYSKNKFLEPENNGQTKWNRKDFELSPDALQEYTFFKQNNRAGFILSALGSGLLMSSVFVSQRNGNLAAGLFSGGCLTMGTSIIFSISSKKHFNKAMRYRNNESFVSH